MLTLSERNALIVSYMPLAKKLARKKVLTVPKRVDLEDLQSAAYFGLVNAAKNYDPDKCKGFAPYATWRIVGEMSDCIRNMSWNKRNHKVKIQQSDFENEHVEDGDEVEINDMCEYVLRQIKDEFARDVVKRYYIGGERLKDIATFHHLSIGRISQVLKSSLSEIRMAA